MTALTRDDEFQRQLLLLTPSSSRMKDRIEDFVRTAGGRLELNDLEIDGISVLDGLWFRVWRVGKVSNSRKQVAPMLRAALERSSM